MLDTYVSSAAGLGAADALTGLGGGRSAVGGGGRGGAARTDLGGEGPAANGGDGGEGGAGGLSASHGHIKLLGCVAGRGGACGGAGEPESSIWVAVPPPASAVHCHTEYSEAASGTPGGTPRLRNHASSTSAVPGDDIAAAGWLGNACCSSRRRALSGGGAGAVAPAGLDPVGHTSLTASCACCEAFTWRLEPWKDASKAPRFPLTLSVVHLPFRATVQESKATAEACVVRPAAIAHRAMFLARMAARRWALGGPASSDNTTKQLVRTVRCWLPRVNLLRLARGAPEVRGDDSVGVAHARAGQVGAHGQ
jgi:hypothetical protein